MDHLRWIISWRFHSDRLVFQLICEFACAPRHLPGSIPIGTACFFKRLRTSEEAKMRIDQLRDLHRNVFMRHVHVELGKIWEKQEVEE